MGTILILNLEVRMIRVAGGELDLLKTQEPSRALNVRASAAAVTWRRCAIRIASEKATFAEIFIQVGFVPSDGGAWLSRRAVGMSRACQMALFSDAIDAQQGLESGLASIVVASDQLMMAAHEPAGPIRRSPSQTLRMPQSTAT